MARHVGSYQDEWSATLQDEEKLARFVSFINAPETADPSITFDTERGQIRPGTGSAREPVRIASASIPVGAPR
jgi:nitrite reductase (NADH) large subunit